MIKKIALIGVGALGSRYLEGFYNIKFQADIYVVDSARQCLERAYKSYRNILNNNISVHFNENLESIPKILDLVIISTTSNVRFDIIDKLYKNKTFKNLLLEKVLFQKEEQYYKTLNIIQDSKVNTWVNCPRRLYDIYTEVKSYGSINNIKSIEVKGSNWMLACNGVHFLDLIQYLTDEQIEGLNISQLDKTVTRSKRVGYLEVSGLIHGSTKKTNFSIESTNDKIERELQIIIKTEANCTVNINETNKIISYKNEKNIKKKSFTVPYMSQLSDQIADNILISKKCKLVKYEESMKYHIIFIKALINHFNKYSNIKYNYCPIT